MFRSLLSLMGLEPGRTPDIRIQTKTAPVLALRELLGRGAIPDSRECPEDLRWLVKALIERWDSLKAGCSGARVSGAAAAGSGNPHLPAVVNVRDLQRCPSADLHAVLSGEKLHLLGPRPDVGAFWGEICTLLAAEYPVLAKVLRSYDDELGVSLR